MTPRERPIIFSGPMIRAILDGTKTQTRRACKFHRDPESGRRYNGGALERASQQVIERACPYGKPGDRLWCRETWAPFDDIAVDERDRGKVFYRADDECYHDTDGIWEPSIHMPRWASRITLEIVLVRVERLQDISEADAIAEGVESNVDDGVTYYGPYGKGHCDPRVAYAWLWESINGEGSWIPNPWVWVISFARVGDTKPEES